MPRFFAGFSAGTVAGACLGALMTMLRVPVSLHIGAVALLVALATPAAVGTLAYAAFLTAVTPGRRLGPLTVDRLGRPGALRAAAPPPPWPRPSPSPPPCAPPRTPRAGTRPTPQPTPPPPEHRPAEERTVPTTTPVIEVSDAGLEDLRARLRATRWPEPWPVDGWEAGTDATELRRLVAYWASDYDWRTHEAAVNALPSRFADIDGTPVHYLRYDAEHPDALPIVLTHGWPSTVLELTALAERLAAPSRHGGDARDAFTVIVPSLPGFAFSPQRPALTGAEQTHELWHRLMHGHLGFRQYAAHGGDLGAGITSRLAEAHPESVVGIHLLAAAAPAGHDPASLTPEEQAHLASVAAWQTEEGGYLHQQNTRPLTLAPALSDSPAGLLSWILEKYRAWSDCGGDLPSRFSDDFLLTQASLYWFTGTISTSFRPYYEYARHLTRRVRRVDVPTALALFPVDLSLPPRSWAERTYRLTRYTRMPRGGHFAAHEEPALLADDITAFLRDLRPHRP
ncbi:alpha/beta fold hydrolase [Streptomyces sp. NPDC003703]|uniref:epoxide hydrolase family protein n=1 Tax=Streptomyces sp. NPDC003283 TaxID=3364681 RepID=UPI0036891C0E